MNVYVLTYDDTYYDDGGITTVGVFSTPEKAQAHADKRWGHYDTAHKYTHRGGMKLSPSVGWESINDGAWLERKFYNSDTGDDVTLHIGTEELDNPSEDTNL